MDSAAQGLSGRLLEILREELKKPVALNDRLLGSGLTINRALRIIARFWSETGIELDVNCFYAHATVGAFVGAAPEEGTRSLRKLIDVRAGSPAETLVVFAGGLSCFLEIQDLIDRLDFPGQVLGMVLTQFGRGNRDPALVADEIAESLRGLDAAGIRGPYRLLGYSFGGIFALELARALAVRGDDIAFLGVIDAPQGEHCWPLPVWLRFMAKRAGRRWATNKQGRANPEGASERAAPERQGRATLLSAVRRALRPLALRFADPRSEHYPGLAPQWIGNYPPRYDAAARQLLRMKGLYRPSPYTGMLTYYRALGGSPVDCDPRAIWPRFLPRAEWVDMRGNHQSVIVGRNAEILARDISRRLGGAGS
ncbi:MAG: thioesterase domain-containing protein [Shinella sp.]|uniref:thioesterase domain-containing protein n=1 Tax=Shinella sp. TaxID=1870904 RepID=UPI004035BE63